METVGLGGERGGGREVGEGGGGRGVEEEREVGEMSEGE